jgi:hypothetical protein
LKQPDPRGLAAITLDGNQCGLLHGVQRALFGLPGTLFGVSLKTDLSPDAAHNGQRQAFVS